MDADLYFSVDIEADGPIPGVYSMLAVGLAVAGRFDGRSYVPIETGLRTFYRELRPISKTVDKEALEVAQLDRGRLIREGAEPAKAMTELANWVEVEAGADRPVLVGFPIVFDWMFLHWYLIRFVGKSPFGHSDALDMKTMYQQKARVTLGSAGLDDLPVSLKSTKPHTHNALDDAVEQAEIFTNLVLWLTGESA
jgi:hypothetical protein